MRRAGLAALGVVALFAALTLWTGFTPLYDEAAVESQRPTPFYRSLTAGFFLLFISCGWAYGAAVGTIKSHRDVVAMMAKGLEGMLPYLVLIFFGAHFVAMYGWSNLGPITAIAGADQLRAMNAPPALLLPMLTTMSAWLDFLIASGSAKWTAMSPVATPMMMLLGISPEMTTAAYRVGDSVTNLILKWQKLMSPHLRLSILSAVKTVLSGITAGLVTPARIGEYAGRLVTSDPDHRTEVVSATLLGSISQNLCNIIIGLLFSTYFLRSVFDPGLGGTIIYGTLVMAQAILLVYLYYRLPQVAHRLEKLPGPEFKRKYSDRLKALDLYKPDLLHTVMALSVMRYLVYFVQYVMIVRFLGSPAGFIESSRCQLDLRRTVFRSDHASNWLVLKGTLGADKERLLAQVRQAIAEPGGAHLRPAWVRGL